MGWIPLLARTSFKWATTTEGPSLDSVTQLLVLSPEQIRNQAGDCSQQSALGYIVRQ